VNESGGERAVGRSGREAGNGNPTGYIMVRLVKEAEDSVADDLHVVTRSPGFKALHEFLLEHDELTATRAVQRTPVGKLRELEKRSLKTDFPVEHSITLYWRIDATRHHDPEELRCELSGFPEIEAAYHQTRVFNASPNGAGSCVNYLADQKYLNSAPVGIDAHWAWTRFGGKGQRVKVIDLECGWNLTHVDLPGPALLFGDNAGDYGYPGMANHGTQALGVIGAIDDGCGITGIAPKLAALDAVSHYIVESPPVPGTNYEDRAMHVSEAIIAATLILCAGDILVLEVQRIDDAFSHSTNKNMPTEIEPVDAIAIRLATSQGIIVIEASGNGSRNLANFGDVSEKHTLDRDNQDDYCDSGAIVVGACKSAVTGNPQGHELSDYTNFGSRVDCYAWGYGIMSTTGSVGENDSYDNSFGRTSGATAIIAGACAVVQSWYRAWCGFPMTPMQMRALMSNPNYGTPQAEMPGPKKPIGTMPDLKKIMNRRVRILQVIRCMMERSRIR
jgi:serine protease